MKKRIMHGEPEQELFLNKGVVVEFPYPFCGEPEQELFLNVTNSNTVKDAV